MTGVAKDIAVNVGTKVAFVAIIGVGAYLAYRYLGGKIKEKVGAVVDAVVQAPNKAVQSVIDSGHSPGAGIGAPSYLGGFGTENPFYTPKSTAPIYPIGNTAGIPYKSEWANSDYIDPLTQKALQETFPLLYNFPQSE